LNCTYIALQYGNGFPGQMNLKQLEDFHTLLQHLERRVFWHLLIKQNVASQARDVALNVICIMNAGCHKVS